MRTCQSSLGATAPIRAPARLVVVPRTPGPVRVLGAGDPGPADELDAAIDELFGQTTDERPGPFDLGLIVGGLALGAWSLFGGGGGLGLSAGVVLLMLGIALPARAVVQAIRRRGEAVERRRAATGGYPLDGSHPATAALIDAYDRLLATLAMPAVVDHDDALDAAHLALVEVATLLDGATPGTPVEVDYVERRTKAIDDLTTDLLAARRTRLARDGTDESRLTDLGRDRATALAVARDELESVDGLGSLGRLESLRGRVEGGVDDVAS